MVGRTTQLDPRTNDPYFGSSGKLRVTDTDNELRQRLDILMHTQVASVVDNLDYGIDYRWITKNLDVLTSDNAVLLELVNRIQLGVEEAITSFEITGTKQVGNSLEISMIISGRESNKTKTTVTVQ